MTESNADKGFKYIIDYFGLSQYFNYYAFGLNPLLYSYTRKTKNY